MINVDHVIVKDGHVINRDHVTRSNCHGGNPVLHVACCGSALSVSARPGGVSPSAVLINHGQFTILPSSARSHTWLSAVVSQQQQQHAGWVCEEVV